VYSTEEAGKKRGEAAKRFAMGTIELADQKGDVFHQILKGI